MFVELSLAGLHIGSLKEFYQLPIDKIETLYSICEKRLSKDDKK